jgi:hypothetical protein
MVVASPAKDVLEQVQEQIERGDMPDETIMREARVIHMESIVCVRAKPRDGSLKVEYRTDQGLRTDTFEYTSAELRDEILGALHSQSAGRLKRRMEKGSLLSAAGAPGVFLILVIIATAICLLGVYSTTTRSLTGQISPTQIQVMQFLIDYGMLAVMCLGGLLALISMAWLAFSLLRPQKVIVLRAKAP